MADDVPPSPPFRTLAGRALRLRCLICGTGRPFHGLFGMRRRCPECGYAFEREGGYFLGSIYLSYGAAAVIALGGHLLLQYVYDVSATRQMISLGGAAALLPVLWFRHSRSLWMLLDLSFDPPAAGDFPPTHLNTP